MHAYMLTGLDGHVTPDPSPRQGQTPQSKLRHGTWISGFQAQALLQAMNEKLRVQYVLCGSWKVK